TKESRACSDSEGTEHARGGAACRLRHRPATRRPRTRVGCRENARGRNVMKLPRRRFLHLAAGAAMLPAATRVAWSQSYPTRPVTLVAPWPPGGAVDILCRTVAQPLGARLGQTVVVE